MSKQKENQKEAVKERNIQPFWNNFCKETSEKLWMPSKEDCKISKPASLNDIPIGKIGSSWFSKICLYPDKKQIEQIFPEEKYPIEQEIEVVRSEKIRIYPDKEQRHTLRVIFGISRYTYNYTVDYLRLPDIKANWMEIKTEIIQNLPEWSKEAPYQVRSIAVKDACIAVKNAKRKYKEGGQFQEVHHRSRKNPKQSCYIPKSAIDEKGFFKTILGTMKFAEPIPETIEYDCRLVYEYGKWFVCIPVKKTTMRNAIAKQPIVSLDPGVRTFQTFFDLGKAGFIGSRACEKIFLLCRRLDDIYSKMSKVKTAKRRQNLKRASYRLRFRIRNLKDELHFQTANYLCKHYHLIVIPTFCATEMSNRKTRKIQSKTVRNMLNLGQSQFRERLKQTAEIYGSHVIEINEAYTSKTCTRCGHIHEKLGGAEWFKCPECGLIISRDVNGARNIMLRAMLDQAAMKIA